MWGDVPLRLTNPTELNAKSLWISKSPRAAIYIQVKKDLIDAIAGLPARELLSRILEFQMLPLKPY
jgi:hypothetical protein